MRAGVGADVRRRVEEAGAGRLLGRRVDRRAEVEVVAARVDQGEVDRGAGDVRRDLDGRDEAAGQAVQVVGRDARAGRRRPRRSTRAMIARWSATDRCPSTTRRRDPARQQRPAASPSRAARPARTSARAGPNEASRATSGSPLSWTGTAATRGSERRIVMSHTVAAGPLRRLHLRYRPLALRTRPGGVRSACVRGRRAVGSSRPWRPAGRAGTTRRRRARRPRPRRRRTRARAGRSRGRPSCSNHSSTCRTSAPACRPSTSQPSGARGRARAATARGAPTAARWIREYQPRTAAHAGAGGGATQPAQVADLVSARPGNVGAPRRPSPATGRCPVASAPRRPGRR